MSNSPKKTFRQAWKQCFLIPRPPDFVIGSFVNMTNPGEIGPGCDED